MSKTDQELRDYILGAIIPDMIMDMLYYDRKEDEILQRDVIERLVKDGVLTTDEICARFKKELKIGLGEK